MSTMKIRAVRVLRTVAGSNPYTAKVLKKAFTRPKIKRGANYTQINGRSYTVVRSNSGAEENRVGIYLRGGCDLPAMFRLAPLMRDTFTGTCAIKRDPNEIAGSRSDLMMQTLHDLDGVPAEALEEVLSSFKLGFKYFSNELFNPSFTVTDDHKQDQEFDKTVMVLSAGPDYTRTLYRHREHGFLVDPGGFWLNHSVENALSDMSKLQWFNKTFKSVGRLSPEDFRREFGALVTEIKKRTGAHILVLNVLTVDPSDLTHNYRLVKNPDNARRRAFDVALADMSQLHDFDVLDVDRILKTRGITDQVDFAHPSEQQFTPMAEEAYRILKDREIL